MAFGGSKQPTGKFYTTNPRGRGGGRVWRPVTWASFVTENLIGLVENSVESAYFGNAPDIPWCTSTAFSFYTIRPYKVFILFNLFNTLSIYSIRDWSLHLNPNQFVIKY